MCALERLSRGKARLSICDVLNRGRRNGAGPLLVQCEQGAIIAHLIGIKNRHGSISQDQPALFIPDRHDSVTYVTLLVLHDNGAEIIRKYSEFTQRDVFYDGIVFAIASSAAKRLKRRNREIGIAVLSPVARRSNGHVHYAIDPSQATPARAPAGARCPGRRAHPDGR